MNEIERQILQAIDSKKKVKKQDKIKKKKQRTTADDAEWQAETGYKRKRNRLKEDLKEIKELESEQSDDDDEEPVEYVIEKILDWQVGPDDGALQVLVK